MNYIHHMGIGIESANLAFRYSGANYLQRCINYFGLNKFA